MQTFAYYRPDSIYDLFDLIHRYSPNFRLLAGGTDLLVRLKTGKFTPEAVIDIKNISELNDRIVEDVESVHIGALTLMAALEINPVIKRHFPALAEAAHHVGSVQIRNRATIAGNLCNASPAADSAPSLYIYNAKVNCISPRGKRTLPLVDFILGPGKTALASDELVQSITIPIPGPNQSAAFTRLSRRKGVDLATINLCCQVTRSGITRFAQGAVGPVPILVEDVDGLLTSETTSLEQKKLRVTQLMERATPISDSRASKEYRQAMLDVLGMRALNKALQQLQLSQ